MSHKNLLAIYKLFDLWAQEFTFACQPGCSACCTQNVSMTMLEGELILDYIKTEKPELLNKIQSLPENHFAPLTTNEFAAACLNEKMPAEIENTWSMAPCLFLKDNRCLIYPVRSFMCRSLGSKTPCEKGGQAEMDPLFLTLNTVILQCIEHLDQGRSWGNMSTILKKVSADQEIQGVRGKYLRISQAIPGFLIPPEEMDQIENKLRTLLRIANNPQY